MKVAQGLIMVTVVVSYVVLEVLLKLLLQLLYQGVAVLDVSSLLQEVLG